MAITWAVKPFQDLTPRELYAALRLRSEVFVVEQACVFLDADNKDQTAWHLMGWDGARLLAYARILPAGVRFAEASIGRVVTAPSERRSGLGRELMQRAIQEACALFGPVPLRMGCQVYLKEFYESFGFVPAGDHYLEDGIEHIEMLRVS